MGGSGARNREDRRTMKSKILSALREAPGYVSGQELCDELQVSRTAVWKVINQLKEEGYVIESVPRKGYRLVSHPDSITAEEVKSRMTKELSDWKIVYYDEIDSTNNEAKRRRHFLLRSSKAAARDGEGAPGSHRAAVRSR